MTYRLERCEVSAKFEPPPQAIETRVSWQDDLKEVATKHGLSVQVLMSRSRAHHISHARWDAFIALQKRGWSLPRIGNHFGLDHTTVLYGIRKARKAAEARS